MSMKKVSNKTRAKLGARVKAFEDSKANTTGSWSAGGYPRHAYHKPGSLKK